MQAINTDKAPAAIGSYSQAISSDKTVYLSGQIPLDPKNMQLCSDEIQPQIEQVFDNLSQVCKAAGGSLANVVKLTVYLIDLTHAAIVNAVMERYFNQPFPARAAIGVAALPKNSLVEVDAIMVLE